MWRPARIVLLATTVSAAGVSAFAADLPPQMEPVAPVAYVPAFSWTGFYLAESLDGSKRTPTTQRGRRYWERHSS